MGTKFRDFKTMDMLVGTRIRGLSISERTFTFLIFCWVLKFVAFPTPKYTKINVQRIEIAYII